MDVLQKITKLQLDRKWTAYRLSQESGIPQTTISSWYQKDMIPSIPSLEKICAAFHITLAQFFAENNTIEVTPEQQKLLDAYARLNKYQQTHLLNFLDLL